MNLRNTTAIAIAIAGALIATTASAASNLRGGHIRQQKQKDRNLDPSPHRRLAKCKKLVVYRDVRDYKEGKTYVGRHGYLGQKDGRPGDAFVLHVPLYDKSDRSEQKEIGVFDEIWTWSLGGEKVGSMMFTMYDDAGEERGQLAAEFTRAGATNAITGGTLEFAGTNGYLTADRAGRFSKENGFYNELTLNYDCF